jgi:hypothetical protein
MRRMTTHGNMRSRGIILSHHERRVDAITTAELHQRQRVQKNAQVTYSKLVVQPSRITTMHRGGGKCDHGAARSCYHNHGYRERCECRLKCRWGVRSDMICDIRGEGRHQCYLRARLVLNHKGLQGNDGKVWWCPRRAAHWTEIDGNIQTRSNSRHADKMRWSL